MEKENTASGDIFLPNSFRDPYSFEDIICLFSEITGRGLRCDMSRVHFIEPYSMVSLLLLERQYLRQRGEKLSLINIPVTIQQYLTRMDFFKHGFSSINEELDERLLLKRTAFSRRVLEIIEIPGKERESVRVISDAISRFRKRASHILKYWISDYIIDFFVTVISELCQNIFEHSLDSGYLSMQTYSIGKENIVRLVISDSGIGIMKSFENSSEPAFETEADLIRMTLTTPISSKREFGYGLCQVNSIVERLGGMLFIRSGHSSVTAVYNKKGKKSPYMFLKNDLQNFGGTQISISLSG